MNIGFCISGGGRVVRAILSAQQEGLLSLGECHLFADRPNGAVALSRDFDLPLTMLDCRKFRHREDYRSKMGHILNGLPVNALFLTFDWLLPEDVITHYGKNIVNLHMSLLPLFKGRHAPKKALNSSMKLAGVTTHRVTAGMDEGPVIAQAVTPLRPDMDADKLGLALFMKAVPLGIQTLRWMCQDRLDSDGKGGINIADARFDDGPYFPQIDEDIASFARDWLKSSGHA